MLRRVIRDAAGRGTLIMTPEGEEELAELRVACPVEKPADSVTGYEWKDGEIHLFHRKDDSAKLPPVSTAPLIDGYQPVPTSAMLEAYQQSKLITLAAELEAVHKPGESKAALIAKIITAWKKRNEALDAADARGKAGK